MQVSVRIKVIADCMEALIGAAHEGGGPTLALHLLKYVGLLPEAPLAQPSVPPGRDSPVLRFTPFLIRARLNLETMLIASIWIASSVHVLMNTHVHALGYACMHAHHLAQRQRTLLWCTFAVCL